MSAKVLRSTLAEIDLLEIWEHIAVDNLKAADRFLEKIETKCQMLASRPEMGERWIHPRGELRRFTVGNYVIFFRSTNGGIEVVRVVSGFRDLEQLRF